MKKELVDLLIEPTLKICLFAVLPTQDFQTGLLGRFFLLFVWEKNTILVLRLNCL